MSTHAIGWGLAGLAGALLVGAGEALLQLAPGADYSDPAYGYLGGIAAWRQSLGHWLAVSAAPLYLGGYWHLSRNLAPRKPLAANILFAGMAYAFILGAVWIGQRFFIAAIVKAVNAGDADPALLHTLAAHHEPFVMALRIALSLFSLAGVWLIASGASHYPRWMALASPAFVLALIFALYWRIPEVGGWILSIALNAAHVVVFGLSIASLAFRER